MKSFILNKIINNLFDIPSGLYNKKNKYLLIATVGGLGYAKKAPGTWASAAAVLLGIILNFFGHSLLIIAFTMLLIVGFFVSEQCYSDENKDPSYIVIDEVVGQLLAMILVQNNIWLVISSFIIFRILDITKPWLIGMAEKKYKGGIAIMMDDILAGFIALILVTILSILI